MEITYYGDKRLVQYLCKGDRCLIRFDDHGLGDCVMFYPLYQRLKELYPDVTFNLKAGRGQEYFDDLTEERYDKFFYIKFYEFNVVSEPFSRMSKPEICCNAELGIPFTKDLDFTWKPHKPYKSDITVPPKTIGLAFQVTSNPYKSIDYSSANKIWNTIKDIGYNPLEVHFEHINRNYKNAKFSFIDNTCRKFLPTVENVISVINQCDGFMGVNTGTFCTAAAMKNGNVLHLFKRYHFYPHYKKSDDIKELDCRSYNLIDNSIIFNYINNIRR